MTTKKKTTTKAQGTRPPAEDVWQIATVPLADVVLNPDYQMRVEARSPSEYFEAIVNRNGDWPFPAIKCCEVRGKLICVDGFTRCQAALDYVAEKSVEGFSIPVSYKKATAREALIEALKSNADHGYRRTNADKRNAVLRAIGAMPTATAHKIADACSVSHTYVYTIKAQLTTDSEAPTAEQVTATAADHEANAAAETLHQEQLTAAENKQKELGACPNCKVKGRWIERDDGWVCGDCLHPHGEPAGNEDEAEPVAPTSEPETEPVTVDETTPSGFEVPDVEQPDDTKKNSKPAKPTAAMLNLRADKIKKAKAAVGVIVRIADDLGFTDSITSAIEAIQAKLAEG